MTASPGLVKSLMYKHFESVKTPLSDFTTFFLTAIINMTYSCRVSSGMIQTEREQNEDRKVDLPACLDAFLQG